MDGLEHFQDGLVGAAVQGAPQSANASGRASEQIGAAGGNHANGRGRTILFVVGMKQENQVQGFDRFGFDVVVLVGDRKHHVQEIGRVLELRLGVDDGQTARLAVGKGGNGADL